MSHESINEYLVETKLKLVSIYNLLGLQKTSTLGSCFFDAFLYNILRPRPKKFLHLKNFKEIQNAGKLPGGTGGPYGPS